MTIPNGTVLGPYRVISAIGAGGMGEVYQAHDNKLGRDVAIKVLPERFARDPERLARFQREAKMLAALNHPNIATIHGLEQSGDTHYLVMELVPGETLAERIQGGAIPVDEALPIARQVADAIEYAHDKSVIHRDLKPANIKITAEGTVKVLDFGLAKALSDEPVQEDISNSPTLSMAATRQGVILGTAAYMSPEQAKGKSVDRRADVWAFAAVVYEMLTGKQAFPGEDLTEVLAAVVRADPDWNRLPPTTPAAVRNLLRRCLEKNVRRRLGHISEARILIEDVLSGAAPTETNVAQVAPAPTLSRPALLLCLGALLLSAAIAGLAAWTLKPAPRIERAVSRFDYNFPAGQDLRNTGRSVMAVSPDGSHFVYNTTKGLYLRSMDDLQAHLIPGTEDALANPFFSPDGQWVAYWQDQLKKINITGGTPVTICPAANIYNASWAPDNTILFGQLDGIHRVSASGGAPELIIKSEASELFDGPRLLPGGKWVLFSIASTANAWDEARVVIQSLETKERRELWRGGSDARYVPTGHIVYAHDNNLFAIPFDLGKLSVTGGPVPVVQGIMRAAISASANYGISDGGSLVYVAGSGGGSRRTLVWVDRQGHEEQIKVPERAYTYARISPDGTRIALDIRDQENDIWIWDLARQTLARLTFDPGLNRSPVWTPDGKRLAFSALRNNNENIYWQAADGSGAQEALTAIPNGAVLPLAFSPDGTQLLFTPTDSPIEISRVKVTGDRQPELLLHNPFNQSNPEISPDGRWLVYQSNESGRDEVYVRPYPDVNSGRWQISTGGGSRPMWNPNGRELFYAVATTGMFMSVSIEPGATLKAGTPQLVFQEPYLVGGLTNGRSYSISPDGRRFLMIKAAGGEANAPPPQIVVTQNWFEELKHRVPAGTN